jgi:hypothetical protein
LGCHYATKHGVQASTVRDVAQTSRCIPEAIRLLILMLPNNLDILLLQDMVILYFFLLNVTNVLSFDSRVFLAELTKKITKYFLISFDILIWMLLGRVPQELLLNLQECSMKKSPLAVFMIFKCSPSLWVNSRLTTMGGGVSSHWCTASVQQTWKTRRKTEVLLCVLGKICTL